MYSKPLNNSFIFIFFFKISGLLHNPIVNFWYSNLPQGNTIVHSFRDIGHDVMCSYLLIYVINLECLGIGKGFVFMALFSSLKSDINLTVPFILDIIIVGAAH